MKLAGGKVIKIPGTKLIFKNNFKSVSLSYTILNSVKYKLFHWKSLLTNLKTYYLFLNTFLILIKIDIELEFEKA